MASVVKEGRRTKKEERGKRNEERGIRKEERTTRTLITAPLRFFPRNDAKHVIPNMIAAKLSSSMADDDHFGDEQRI